MTSTFHGIETAKRSLASQMAALNTTGHNIANTNTEGYSRQKVSLTAASAMAPYGLIRSTESGQLGSGVEATSINRIRDSYLDTQYRYENGSLGSLEIQYDTLSKLETVISEPSDTGLQTVINNFWDAWSDVSVDPSSATTRKVLTEAALSLTDALNQASKQMDVLSTDLTNSIELKATEINGLLQQVADLNAQINKIEGLGDDANDLRDSRDLAMDKLSKIANVSVSELSTGYEVTVGGVLAVTGSTVTNVTSASLQTAFQAGTLNSGEVNGLFISRDQYAADYKNQLNQMANTLANGNMTLTIPAGSVLPEGTILNDITYSDANNNRTLTSDLTVTVAGLNGLHKLGYTLTGAAGGNFFTTSDSSATITAGNITLNNAIQADDSLIATSMKLDSSGNVVTGNNQLALLISELSNTKMDVGTSTPVTLNDYYGSIVGKLGAETQGVQRKLANAETLTEQVESSRQSVSGVSLDEEMSNLIKYQQAYSSAARYMTTYDQLLDKLINGTGTVGL